MNTCMHAHSYSYTCSCSAACMHSIVRSHIATYMVSYDHITTMANTQHHSYILTIVRITAITQLYIVPVESFSRDYQILTLACITSL